MKFVVTFLVFVFTFQANAAKVYQCKDDRGRTHFSDQPCAGEGREFKAQNKISEVKSSRQDVDTITVEPKAPQYAPPKPLNAQRCVNTSAQLSFVVLPSRIK